MAIYATYRSSQPPDYRTYSPEVTSFRSNLPVHRSTGDRTSPFPHSHYMIKENSLAVKRNFSVFDEILKIFLAGRKWGNLIGFLRGSEGGALAGGAGGLRRVAAWGMHPPFSFRSCRKENGPCTVQKKRRFAAKFPLFGEIWPKYGGRANRGGTNLLGFIRLRYTLAFGRRFKPQFGTLSAGLWVHVGRVSPTAPLPLRGLFLHVGVACHPVGRGALAPPQSTISARADAHIGPLTPASLHMPSPGGRWPAGPDGGESAITYVLGG